MPGSKPSNRRSPEPRITGVTCRSISSTRPALIACRAHEAPPAMEMSRSPAAACGLCVGRLDSFGHEMEGGSAVHFDRRVFVMGEDEDRAVVWRGVAPPAFPVRVGPFATNGPEHVAAHDGCAHAVQHVGHHLPVDRVIAGRADMPMVNSDVRPRRGDSPRSGRVRRRSRPPRSTSRDWFASCQIPFGRVDSVAYAFKKTTGSPETHRRGA